MQTPKARSQSSSTDSSISMQEMFRIIDRLKHECHRSSTRDTYYRIWKIFCQFYLKLDIKPSSWEDRLVLFTGFLIDSKLKSTSVRSYISAIRSILWEDNIPLNEDTSLIKALTCACKLQNDRIVHRMPILKGVLKLVIDQVHNKFGRNNQPYLTILYSTVFLAAYYGFIGIREIAKAPMSCCHAMSTLDKIRRFYLF